MIESDRFIKQARRFAVSGLLVTGLHVLVATWFMHNIMAVPAMANGVAFVIATLFSYLINTTWSFSSRLHGRTLMRFSIVSIMGCALAVGISGLADYYGLSYWFGIAAVVTVVPVVTFVLHSFWTYR